MRRRSNQLIVVVFVVAAAISTDVTARRHVQPKEPTAPAITYDELARLKPDPAPCRAECAEAWQRLQNAYDRLKNTLDDLVELSTKYDQACKAKTDAFDKQKAARDALNRANPKTQQLLDAVIAADRATDTASQKCDSAAADLRRENRRGVGIEKDFYAAEAEYERCCHPPKAPEPACLPECEDALSAVRKAQSTLESMWEEINQEAFLEALVSRRSTLLKQIPQAEADVAAAEKAYAECCKKKTAASAPAIDIGDCEEGFCGNSKPPSDIFVGVQIEITFQEMGGETPNDDGTTIQPSAAATPGKGAALLSSFMPTLHAAPISLEQARAQGGVQFLVSSLGGSTGQTLTMQVLNLTGRAVKLQGAIALQPVNAKSADNVKKAFAKLAGNRVPTSVPINGFCLEFEKLPPAAGQVFRVAPAARQQQFVRYRRVMSAANRIRNSGQLHPDSSPGPYADSIKQWAIWAVERNLDQQRFADAFVTYTRKQVERAGRQWNGDAERQVRQAAPNRWRDISQVLAAAIP